MKKLAGFTLGASIILLSSCGSLTEDEAKRLLKNEAETLSVSACDCINTLTASGDQLIEEVANCRGKGQSKLYELSQEKDISDIYPTVLEDAEQLYFEKVDACME